MIKTCGVDYQQDDRAPCGLTFDDARRLTICPHPGLHELDWRSKVRAYADEHPPEPATSAQDTSN